MGTQSKTEIGPAVSGFWRRLSAFLVDALILGAVGWLFALLCYEWLLGLTWEGKLIGFAIALPYITLLNSEVGGGATLGKRLLRIRVVGIDGKPISIIRSFVRYLVLALPFFLNGAEIPENSLAKVIGIISAAFVLGFGIPILYYLVFNKRNRRSLHDIIAGTVVLRHCADISNVDWRIWKVHHFVVISLVVSVGLTTALILNPVSPELLTKLGRVQSLVLTLPETMTAGVTQQTTIITTTKSGTRTNSYIAIVVRVREEPSDPDYFSSTVADLARSSGISEVQDEYLVVTTYWGYDIGIAYFSKSFSKQFAPIEHELK